MIPNIAEYLWQDKSMYEIANERGSVINEHLIELTNCKTLPLASSPTLNARSRRPFINGLSSSFAVCRAVKR